MLSFSLSISLFLCPLHFLQSCGGFFIALGSAYIFVYRNVQLLLYCIIYCNLLVVAMVPLNNFQGCFLSFICLFSTYCFLSLHVVNYHNLDAWSFLGGILLAFSNPTNSAGCDRELMHRQFGKNSLLQMEKSVFFSLLLFDIFFMPLFLSLICNDLYFGFDFFQVLLQ